MSAEIDNRVVELSLDNRNFEHNAKLSLATIEELKKSLDFQTTTTGLDQIAKSANKLKFDGLEAGIEEARKSFSALEIAGVTALVNISNKAIDTGLKMAKGLSIDQITKGFSKYETELRSVQTLENTVSASYEQIVAQLQKLQWYTDETSYDYEAMINNISSFTASGVNLFDAVSAMQGIGNMAGFAGASVYKASHAMDGFSKAIGMGAMTTQIWNSWLKTSGFNVIALKDAFLETAAGMGTLKKVGEKTYKSLDDKFVITAENFTEALTKTRWLTKDVMLETFKSFSSYSDLLYEFVNEYERLTDSSIDTSSAMELLADSSDLSAEKIEAFVNAYNSLDPKNMITMAEASEQLATWTESIAERAFKSGQVYRTFGDAVNATKDAVSSGWMTVMKNIMGDAHEAQTLWTEVGSSMYEIFMGPMEALISASAEYKNNNGIDYTIRLVKVLAKSFKNVQSVLAYAFSSLLPEGQKFSTMLVDGLTNIIRFMEAAQLTDEAVQGLSDGLAILLSPLKLIGKLLNVAAAVLLRVGALTSAILNTALPRLSKLRAVLTGLHKALTATFGTGLVGIINLALYAFGKLQDAFDFIVSTIQNAVNAIKSFASELTIYPALEKFGKIVLKVAAAFGAIAATPFVLAIKGARKAVTAISNSFVKLRTWIGETVKGTTTLAQKMNALSAAIGTSLITKFTDLTTLLKNNLTTTFGGVVKFVSEFIASISEFEPIKRFANVVEILGTSLVSFGKNVKTAFTTPFKVAKANLSLFDKEAKVNGLNIKKSTSIFAAFRTAISNVKDELSKVDFSKAFSNVLSGLSLKDLTSKIDIGSVRSLLTVLASIAGLKLSPIIGGVSLAVGVLTGKFRTFIDTAGAFITGPLTNTFPNAMSFISSIISKSSEIWNNLTSRIGGAASAFTNIANVIRSSSIVKGISSIIDSIKALAAPKTTTNLEGVTATIRGISDAGLKGESVLSRFFKVVKFELKTLIYLFKSGWDIFSGFFKFIFGELKSFFVELASFKVPDIASPFEKIRESIVHFISVLGNHTLLKWNPQNSMFNVIKNVIVDVFGTLKGILKVISPFTIIVAAVAIAIISLIHKVRKLFDTVYDLTDTIGYMFGRKRGSSIAATVLALSTALFVFAASMVALAKVPSDKLNVVFRDMLITLGGIIAATASLGLISKFLGLHKGFAAAAMSLVSFAASVSILCRTFDTLAVDVNTSWPIIFKKIVEFGGLMALFSAAYIGIARLSKGYAASMIGMIGMAWAFKTFVNTLASINAHEKIEALINVIANVAEDIYYVVMGPWFSSNTVDRLVAVLGAILSFTTVLFGVKMITKIGGIASGLGKGLLGIAVALLGFTAVVKIAGSMRKGEIKRGLATVASLSALIAGIIAVCKFVSGEGEISSKGPFGRIKTTKFSGASIRGVASTMNGLVVAMTAMLVLVKLINYVKPEEYSRGIKVIIQLSALFAAFIAFTSIFNGGSIGKLHSGTTNSKAVVAAATGLLAVAVALRLLIAGTKDLTKSELMKVGVSLVGGVLAISAIMIVAGKTAQATKASIGYILVMFGSLITIISMFSRMDESTVQLVEDGLRSVSGVVSTLSTVAGIISAVMSTLFTWGKKKIDPASVMAPFIQTMTAIGLILAAIVVMIDWIDHSGKSLGEIYTEYELVKTIIEETIKMTAMIGTLSIALAVAAKKLPTATAKKMTSLMLPVVAVIASLGVLFGLINYHVAILKSKVGSENFDSIIADSYKFIGGIAAMGALSGALALELQALIGGPGSAQKSLQRYKYSTIGKFFAQIGATILALVVGFGILFGMTVGLRKIFGPEFENIISDTAKIIALLASVNVLAFALAFELKAFAKNKSVFDQVKVSDVSSFLIKIGKVMLMLVAGLAGLAVIYGGMSGVAMLLGTTMDAVISGVKTLTGALVLLSGAIVGMAYGLIVFSRVKSAIDEVSIPDILKLFGKIGVMMLGVIAAFTINAAVFGVLSYVSSKLGTDIYSVIEDTIKFSYLLMAFVPSVALLAGAVWGISKLSSPVNKAVASTPQATKTVSSTGKMILVLVAEMLAIGGIMLIMNKLLKGHLLEWSKQIVIFAAELTIFAGPLLVLSGVATLISYACQLISKVPVKDLTAGLVTIGAVIAFVGAICGLLLFADEKSSVAELPRLMISFLKASLAMIPITVIAGVIAGICTALGLFGKTLLKDTGIGIGIVTAISLFIVGVGAALNLMNKNGFVSNMPELVAMLASASVHMLKLSAMCALIGVVATGLGALTTFFGGAMVAGGVAILGIVAFTMLVVKEIAKLTEWFFGENPEALETNLDRMVLIATKLADTIGGFAGHLVGSLFEGIIQGFGSGIISGILDPIREFIEQLNTLNPDPEVLTKVLDFVTRLPLVMAGMAGWEIGSWIGKGIFGDDAFSQFTNMKESLTGLVGALEPLVLASGTTLTPAKLDVAMQVMDLVDKLVDVMPTSGGLKGLILGNTQELDTFAKGMQQFASATVSWSATFGFVNTKNIEIGCKVMDLIGAVAENLPNTGGALADFLGDNTMDVFADQANNAISDIFGFVKGCSDILSTYPNAEQLVTDMTNVIAILTNSEKTISNSGGLIGWIAGNNDLGAFGTNVSKLGGGLKSMYDSVSGIDNWTSIYRAVGILNELISGERKVSNNGKSLSDFGSSLYSTFSTIANTFKAIPAFEGFSDDNFNSIDNILTRISTVMMNLSQLTVPVEIDSFFQSIIDQFEANRLNVYNKAVEIGFWVCRGFTEDSLSSNDSIIAAYNSGYALGSSAIAGLEDGTDSHSPSLLAKQVGQNVVDGLLIPIYEYSGDGGKTWQKSKELALTVIDGLEDGLKDGDKVITTYMDENNEAIRSEEDTIARSGEGVGQVLITSTIDGISSNADDLINYISSLGYICGATWRNSLNSGAGVDVLAQSAAAGVKPVDSELLKVQMDTRNTQARYWQESHDVFIKDKKLETQVQKEATKFTKEQTRDEKKHIDAVKASTDAAVDAGKAQEENSLANTKWIQRTRGLIESINGEGTSGKIRNTLLNSLDKITDSNSFTYEVYSKYMDIISSVEEKGVVGALKDGASNLIKEITGIDPNEFFKNVNTGGGGGGGSSGSKSSTDSIKKALEEMQANKAAFDAYIKKYKDEFQKNHQDIFSVVYSDKGEARANQVMMEYAATLANIDLSTIDWADTSEEGIKKVGDAWKSMTDAVENRYNSLYQTIANKDLFTPPEEQERISAEDVVQNAEDVIDWIEHYRDAYAEASANGFSREVLAAIADKGEEGYRYLAAMAEMDEEQVAIMNEAAAEKARLAAEFTDKAIAAESEASYQARAAMYDAERQQLLEEEKQRLTVFTDALRNVGVGIDSEAWALGVAEIRAFTRGEMEEIDAKEKEREETFNGVKEQTSTILSNENGEIIGKNFVVGIIRGLREQGNLAADIAEEIASRIVAAAEGPDGFDEESPSKKGAWAGMYFIKGITKGMLEAEPEALAAAQYTANSAVGVLARAYDTCRELATDVLTESPIILTPILNLSEVENGVKQANRLFESSQLSGIEGEVATTGTNNVIFNQYNNSPKALDRLSIYRQTKSQLAMAKGAMI